MKLSHTLTFAGCLAATSLAPPAIATTFTVTNTNDSGAGSLRAAIAAADSDSSPPHTITFNIPGSGPFTIALQSGLPAVGHATTIDASGEALAGKPGVRIDGSAAGGPGVSGISFGIGADGSSLSYLAITGFDGEGIQMTASGVAVTHCYVGVALDGVTAAGNVFDGISIAGANANIGTSILDGNLISGNGGSGILLGNAGGGATIRGNLIGTNATGTAALPNGDRGIYGNGADNVTVGGTSGLFSPGNLISGNTGVGIFTDPFSTGWLIAGNLVGVDIAGTGALGNSGGGIWVNTAAVIGGTAAVGRNLISGNPGFGIKLGQSAAGTAVYGNWIGTNSAGGAAIGSQPVGIDVLALSCTIGGTDAAHRNVISGNSQDGIVVEPHSTGCTIRGNFIGLDATGTVAVGNSGYGIRGDGVHDLTIGGATAADGNVIAGNTGGIRLGTGAHDNAVLDNVIGLDASGTVNLADAGSGIEIVDADHNQIGLPGAGNVIAGFSHEGIDLMGTGATGNSIQGNWIGTNKLLAAGLGNTLMGVYVSRASGNEIGGTAAGAGNVLAHNLIGVWIDRGVRDDVSGNSTFENVLLGIDIGPLGVQPDDGLDADGGANQGQNYPLLSSAIVNGGTTEVEGVLGNVPNTQYRVELFSSPACDPTGFGEGKTYLGSTQVTTDDSGDGNLSLSLGVAVADPFVSATVTDGLGNTSELSPCALVGGPNPGKIQFFQSSTIVYEGGQAFADVVVTRGFGVSGSVSVSFTTSDGTAVAGSDYTDSDQTLTFGPWEVVKVVHVPILFDPASEPSPETVHMALANPTNGATLGLAAADIQIYDYSESEPAVSIGDGSVVEGAAGAHAMNFFIHLTPSDHDVTLAWATADGTAIAGQDYIADGGQLYFPVGTTDLPISVQVFGDSAIEPNEQFYVELTPVQGGGAWYGVKTLATGTIFDDDSTDLIFFDGFESGSPQAWSAMAP